MKIQSYTMVGALLVITLFGVATAKAQSANQRFTANIPFAFSVGNEKLPAGEYEVMIVNPSSDQRVLRIRSLHGTESAMLRTHAVMSSNSQVDAKLVFRGYGDSYFLAQAWTGFDNTGLEAPRSRSENATRNESVAIQQRTESVRLERGQ